MHVDATDNSHNPYNLFPKSNFYMSGVNYWDYYNIVWSTNGRQRFYLVKAGLLLFCTVIWELYCSYSSTQIFTLFCQ